LSGSVDLLLAFLIRDGWPGSADCAISLLVGINMVRLRLSLIMTALPRARWHSTPEIYLSAIPSQIAARRRTQTPRCLLDETGTTFAKIAFTTCFGGVGR
jgi:hypothetical protein